MAYGITVYFNDADIASTRLYTANGDIDITKAYGSQAYSTYGVSGNGLSGTSVFKATPAAGCVFTQWVYRLGSNPETVLTSTDNPFYHTSGVDIEIRAEGAPSPTKTWSELPLGHYASLESSFYELIELKNYKIYRYSVSFARSGTAKFYTEGSVDTYGWVSDSKESIDINGIPTSFDYSNDDSGDGYNFKISCPVVAGTTYYLWVRSVAGEEGAAKVCIEAPAAPAEDLWIVTNSSIADALTEDVKRTMTLNKYDLRCLTVRFANSGTAAFFTTGSTNTIGYISSGGATNADKTNGEPVSYDTTNDHTGGSYAYNFKILHNVTAGVNYHIWVRCKSATASGTTVLCILVPGEFAWTYPKIRGEEFNLTAKEWNNFRMRINFARRNNNLAGSSFADVVKGDDFTAKMYRQARNGIQGLEGYGAYIPRVEEGDTITADMMNILVSELNAMPNAYPKE